MTRREKATFVAPALVVPVSVTLDVHELAPSCSCLLVFPLEPSYAMVKVGKAVALVIGMGFIVGQVSHFC